MLFKSSQVVVGVVVGGIVGGIVGGVVVVAPEKVYISFVSGDLLCLTQFRDGGRSENLGLVI